MAWGWEVALLLNAMFAVAARFSDAPYFASIVGTSLPRGLKQSTRLPFLG